MAHHTKRLAPTFLLFFLLLTSIAPEAVRKEASVQIPAVQRQPVPLTLAYGSDPQQFGVLYLPGTPGPYPVVILIHGGFWRTPYALDLMSGLAEDLARKGIAAWNIEYRRIGDPGGGWPGTLQDVASATDYLRTLALTYPLDLQRVVPVGHSAGGHLAFWLAARPRIAAQSPLATEKPLPLKGIVSQAGVLDLEQAWDLQLGGNAAAELLGGTPEEVPERYAAASPAALLPLGVTQVLVHGDADPLVPFLVSQEYQQKASAAGDSVTLIALPDVDHFEVIDATSQAWALTVQAIEKMFLV